MYLFSAVPRRTASFPECIFALFRLARRVRLVHASSTVFAADYFSVVCCLLMHHNYDTMIWVSGLCVFSVFHTLFIIPPAKLACHWFYEFRPGFSHTSFPSRIFTYLFDLMNIRLKWRCTPWCTGECQMCRQERCVCVCVYAEMQKSYIITSYRTHERWAEDESTIATVQSHNACEYISVNKLIFFSHFIPLSSSLLMRFLLFHPIRFIKWYWFE